MAKTTRATDTLHDLILALGKGDLEVLDVFQPPRGLSISSFAKLVGASTTTVRHYVELELIHPMRMNGKFRFHFPNALEYAAVESGKGLGMSLAAIKAERKGTYDFVSHFDDHSIFISQGSPTPIPETQAVYGAPSPELTAVMNALVQDKKLALEHHIADLETRVATLNEQISAAKQVISALEKAVHHE